MAVTDLRFDGLGQVLLDACPEPVDEILLYAEFEPGVVGPHCYCRCGDGIFWFEADIRKLSDELFAIADEFGDDLRTMTFLMSGGKFSSQFGYTDTFDETAFSWDRAAAAMKLHFGDKVASQAPWQPDIV